MDGDSNLAHRGRMEIELHEESIVEWALILDEAELIVESTSNEVIGEDIQGQSGCSLSPSGGSYESQ